MSMASIQHAFREARATKPLRDFNVNKCKNLYSELRKLGITLDDTKVRKMMSAMDALQSDVTTASISVPVQFLQNWLPGFVYVITAARNIDEFIGINTSGSWEDEQIVQGIMELTGTSQPYGDYTNVPLSSWNTNFNTATVVRFEEGMQVDRLEQERASRMRVDTASSKRESAALALEIQRNYVGFNGYNSGNNNTYGFLNALGLPAYVTVAVGGSGFTTWSTKTFLEITKDIRGAIVSLRTQSADQIDPEKLPLTLAISTNAVDWLSTTSDFGISVRAWLKEAYPNIRVVSAPELNSANGGANVFYLYADRVNDMSTDDGLTWLQNVPTKFMVLGVQQLPKAFVEDYSNATAGVMLKRPYAVVRRSGI